MDVALAALALLVGHTVKGITGFGSALVAVPLVSLIWSPAEAIVLCTFADLIGGIGLFVSVRREVRWTLLAAVVPPMWVGLWLGTGLLAVLPQEALMGLIGAVVAALGAQLALRPVESGKGELTDLPADARALLVQGGVAGLIAGVLGGAVGTPGPPIVLWARRWFADRFFRAQVIAIFVSGAAVGPWMILWRGSVDPATLWRLPFLVPAVALGAAFGAWLAPRMSRVTFGRLVGSVLAAAGLVLLLRALRG